MLFEQTAARLLTGYYISQYNSKTKDLATTTTLDQTKLQDSTTNKSKSKITPQSKKQRHTRTLHMSAYTHVLK
eukprot:m.91406 g.91406  ORF g.91406 m.91406 type:complete len:73 (-) comp26466_c0_seq1:86-304(-)